MARLFAVEFSLAKDIVFTKMGLANRYHTNETLGNSSTVKAWTISIWDRHTHVKLLVTCNLFETEK